MSTFITPLTSSIITVSGEDAATFLHSQLTNNIQTLSETQLRLAGYCTPKGRLFASFWVWRHDDKYFLEVSADIQESARKRLSMFVLRAKAKIVDASSDWARWGISGKDAAQKLMEFFPEIPAQPLTKIQHENLVLMRLADAKNISENNEKENNRIQAHDPIARYQILAPAQHAEALYEKLSTVFEQGNLGLWQWLEVHTGIACITKATQECCIPQSLNFDLVGGIDFQKGCYPGQEIVARTQYRGTVKRRLQLASTKTSKIPAAGTEIFHSEDPAQPCGMIIGFSRSPYSDPENYVFLVEVKLSALETGTIHLHEPGGPTLNFIGQTQQN